MTEQHTPGPWHVEDDQTIWAGDELVAAAQRLDMPMAANARLIAAAPKMFAALVDAESAMFHVLADDGINTPANREAMENALRDARAALEEAFRGQS